MVGEWRGGQSPVNARLTFSTSPLALLADLPPGASVIHPSDLDAVQAQLQEFFTFF